MGNDSPNSRTPLFNEVFEIIQLIRPSIQADGGDIQLVHVDTTGIVSVKFLGACIGCPSLNMTLQATIEATLKERIPAISSVIAVE